MKKILLLAGALLAMVPSSQAGVHFSFGLGLPLPSIVIGAPAPAYYAPPPVYYSAPAPVYRVAAPIYAAPPVYAVPPVYAAPPVYVAPPAISFGFGFGPRRYYAHGYHGGWNYYRGHWR